MFYKPSLTAQKDSLRPSLTPDFPRASSPLPFKTAGGELQTIFDLGPATSKTESPPWEINAQAFVCLPGEGDVNVLFQTKVAKAWKHKALPFPVPSSTLSRRKLLLCT